MDSLKETQPNKWVWQVLPVGLKVCVLMINYQTEDGMPRFKVITIWSQQLEKYVHTFEDILPLILFENPTSSVNLDKEFAYSTRNLININIIHFV